MLINPKCLDFTVFTYPEILCAKEFGICNIVNPYCSALYRTQGVLSTYCLATRHALYQYLWLYTDAGLLNHFQHSA